MIKDFVNSFHQQLFDSQAKRRCKSSGLTLDAEALLVLDDEVLLVVLELA